MCIGLWCLRIEDNKILCYVQPYAVEVESIPDLCKPPSTADFDIHEPQSTKNGSATFGAGVSMEKFKFAGRDDCHLTST
ncbi:hypothetical protein J6590_013603 [Homalodisca vitripennis]|nr:hypothetical protein J6590_013603 [Homalodisca vitripennis]